MNALEAARAAAREIRVHRVRSLLSFAAISVGAASLLYTLAQTQGMQEEVAKNLELMGPGALTVKARDHYKSRGLSRGLTAGDAEAVRREVPGLYMVSPTADKWGSMFFAGKRIWGVRIQGVTPDWRLRDWVYRLRGRFFNAEDLRDDARVCVIVEPGGWVVKPFWAKFYDFTNDFDKFVARRDMLGRRVRLGDHDFLVIGVLKEPPHDLDPRWNSWGTPNLLVPLSSYGAYVRGGGDGGERDSVSRIEIDTGDERTLAASRRRIETMLKVRHRGEDDFEVKDRRADVEDSIREQNKYLAVALILGVVALLSGGIGILNVTLAAVFSRVKEIGIRRALGAGRADVMALFVFEAAMLGLAGGAAGVVLGVVGIRELISGSQREVAKLTWYHAAAMVLLSAAVAAVFAAYPAWLASRLDPIEALREEA